MGSLSVSKARLVLVLDSSFEIPKNGNTGAQFCGGWANGSRPLDLQIFGRAASITEAT